jgi:hypothetical protein
MDNLQMPIKEERTNLKKILKMKSTILEKLSKEIGKDIKEECQVAYILSIVRKLLELSEEKKKYQYLRLYCDWSLHNELSRKSTIFILLESMEKDINLESSGREIAQVLEKRHSNFFKMKIIGDELFDFLDKNEVQTDNLKKNWGSFMKLLLGIVEDSPLNFEDISRDIKKIKEIRLQKEEGSYKYRFSLFDTNKKPKVKLKFK